jgi:hypothetical protein
MGLDWQLAREGVEVKLLSRIAELYVLARSRERMAKERATATPSVQETLGQAC